MADSEVVMCEVLLGFSVVFIVAMIVRVCWVLGRRKTDVKKRINPVKTLVVAGSGGHTTEILRLMSGLSSIYYPRIYIIAETDIMSKDKIEAFENNCRLTDEEEENKEFVMSRYHRILTIPRSREVRQSWLTTIVSTLKATLTSFPIVFTHKPELVVVNGPGTCIPICLAAIIMKIIGVQNATIVYVESLCRVETLSLSGHIMYYLADHFFVQWQQLQDKYPKSIYLGKLV